MMGSNSVSNSSFFTIPFRRHRRQSYDLNPAEETHSVIYLGNVLTVMAKGEASVEKPLAVIWRTFNSKKQRREISMKLSVTRSGLKAETKQLGLTEYWAHRLTYCWAPPAYPRLLCWVYKHEGKRLKPELRCHAVLCRKASEPAQIAARLNQHVHEALEEYKREKLAVEKARKNSLSGVGPRRKLLLQTGSLTYRPPVSRSKSAPRLGSIDEEEEVDDEEEEEEEEEDEMFDVEGEDESLGYRTTPLLGGSVAEDVSSLSSSSCSAPSSAADSALPTDAADFYAMAALEESTASCCVDDNAFSESFPPSYTFEGDSTAAASASTTTQSPRAPFRRQLSMNREKSRLQQRIHHLNQQQQQQGRVDSTEAEAEGSAHYRQRGEESSDDSASAGSAAEREENNLSDESGYVEEEGTRKAADVETAPLTMGPTVKVL